MKKLLLFLTMLFAGFALNAVIHHRCKTLEDLGNVRYHEGQKNYCVHKQGSDTKVKWSKHDSSKHHSKVK